MTTAMSTTTIIEYRRRTGVLAGILCLALWLVTYPVASAEEGRQALLEQAAWGAGVTLPDTAEGTARVEALLQDGLTRDEAVEVALLGNRRLQAAFTELGISAAQLRQAGLYSNPELHVLLSLPEGGGGTNLELELGFNLADLWRVPIRRSAAAAHLDRATMLVAGEILNTVADARRAHDDCLLLEALLEQNRSLLDTVRQWRDHMHVRYEHGYHTDMDLAGAEVAVAEWELEVAAAESGLRVAHARLKRLLGLSGDHEPALAGALPPAPEASPEAKALIRHALHSRPDVLASRHGVTAAGESLSLERRSRWQNVRLGPSFERDHDGLRSWGVALRVGLPLADSNRAARNQAAARLDRARAEAEDLEGAVREQVAVARERLELALERERILRETILPAHRRALEFAEKYAADMQVRMLDVFEARKRLLLAERDHLTALGEALEAQVELEFTVGGGHPGAGSAASG